jgi:hypothetical protein
MASAGRGSNGGGVTGGSKGGRRQDRSLLTVDRSPSNVAIEVRGSVLHPRPGTRSVVTSTGGGSKGSRPPGYQSRIRSLRSPEPLSMLRSGPTGRRGRSSPRDRLELPHRRRPTRRRCLHCPTHDTPHPQNGLVLHREPRSGTRPRDATSGPEAHPASPDPGHRQEQSARSPAPALAGGAPTSAGRSARRRSMHRCHR